MDWLPASIAEVRECACRCGSDNLEGGGQICAGFFDPRQGMFDENVRFCSTLCLKKTLLFLVFMSVCTLR